MTHKVVREGNYFLIFLFLASIEVEVSFFFSFCQHVSLDVSICLLLSFPVDKLQIKPIDYVNKYRLPSECAYWLRLVIQSEFSQSTQCLMSFGELALQFAVDAVVDLLFPFSSMSVNQSRQLSTHSQLTLTLTLTLSVCALSSSVLSFFLFYFFFLIKMNYTELCAVPLCVFTVLLQLISLLLLFTTEKLKKHCSVACFSLLAQPPTMTQLANWLFLPKNWIQYQPINLLNCRTLLLNVNWIDAS